MHGHAVKPSEARLLPVSLTTSIVAVLIAVVALLAHRAHTRSILAQNRMSEEWVHYQSKALGQIEYDALLDFLSFAQLRDPASAATLKAKYQQAIDESGHEQQEIEQRANALEGEVEHRETSADRFDLADVFLEAGLVLMSITLLTKRWLYWGIGLVFAAGGLVIAVIAFIVT